ncbi:prepilin peptidase [Streptomyces sp. NP160]|uniref:prepilin peptidase n=1 Tax=Streptomyces sp. NP160 TaxID=2586637 RepID=UPI00111BA4FE|nr:A24 family peptidase [Streptomyces sp. NP160]TNM64498.1 prepilin peptidase [Streptomyces sp. NP160]
MPATAVDAPLVTLLAVLAGVVGLAVGSFLNVVVWRVPRGLSVVRPSSACPVCAAPVAPRDNVPVLSWLLLRAQCRSCASPISIRYPMVEVGTSVLFAAAAVWAARSGQLPLLPALLYLVAAGMALALIDLDVRRLPDAIVLPSYAAAAILLGLAALIQHDGAALLRAVGGGALLWLLYFALAVARPGGMGFGDVKLAGVLGAYLGYAGWAALVVGGFAAFLLGGLAGAALLAVRRTDRTGTLPFGPFMLGAAVLGLVAGHDIGSWYLEVSGLVPA